MTDDHAALAVIQLLTGPGALAVVSYLLISGYLVPGNRFQELSDKISSLETKIEYLRSEIDELR